MNMATEKGNVTLLYVSYKQLVGCSWVTSLI